MSTKTHPKVPVRQAMSKRTRAPPPPSTDNHKENSSSNGHGNGAARSDDHEDTPPHQEVGERLLTLVLPGDKLVKASISKNTQVLDLLIMIASKNKLNPTGHMITQPGLRPKDPPVQLKSSLRVSEVVGDTVYIIPKHQKDPVAKKDEEKSFIAYERSVLTTILSGKSHKMVIRVDPDKTLRDLLPRICDERGVGLEGHTLRLVHQPEEPLDQNQTVESTGSVEFLLVDLTSQPTGRGMDVMLEQRKKRGSFFGRFSKKSKEYEFGGGGAGAIPQSTSSVEQPEQRERSHTFPISEPPPEMLESPKEQEDTSESGTLKKRRPAPPPPLKKHPTGVHDDDKPDSEASNTLRKRRAPPPPRPLSPSRRTKSLLETSTAPPSKPKSPPVRAHSITPPPRPISPPVRANQQENFQLGEQDGKVTSPAEEESPRVHSESISSTASATYAGLDEAFQEAILFGSTELDTKDSDITGSSQQDSELLAVNLSEVSLSATDGEMVQDEKVSLPESGLEEKLEKDLVNQDKEDQSQDEPLPQATIQEGPGNDHSTNEPPTQVHVIQAANISTASEMVPRDKPEVETEAGGSKIKEIKAEDAAKVADVQQVTTKEESSREGTLETKDAKYAQLQLQLTALQQQMAASHQPAVLELHVQQLQQQLLLQQQMISQMMMSSSQQPMVIPLAFPSPLQQQQQQQHMISQQQQMMAPQQQIMSPPQPQIISAQQPLLLPPQQLMMSPPMMYSSVPVSQTTVQQHIYQQQQQHQQQQHQLHQDNSTTTVQAQQTPILATLESPTSKEKSLADGIVGTIEVDARPLSPPVKAEEVPVEHPVYHFVRSRDQTQGDKVSKVSPPSTLRVLGKQNRLSVLELKKETVNGDTNGDGKPSPPSPLDNGDNASSIKEKPNESTEEAGSKSDAPSGKSISAFAVTEAPTLQAPKQEKQKKSAFSLFKKKTPKYSYILSAQKEFSRKSETGRLRASSSPPKPTDVTPDGDKETRDLWPR